MAEVDVSVVMPAWNAQAWIADSLTSVLQQTYPADRLEVVVSDDGSTDETVAVATALLQRSGHPYRILSSTIQQGPAHARNLGWRAARGRWLQFLDADDLLAESKVARQVSAIVDAPADVAAVYSSWGRLLHHDSGWTQSPDVVSPHIGDDPLCDLLHPANFMATGSQLFRRDWLDTVCGFNPECRLIEDVDLLLRIAIRGGRFVRLPSANPLFWYRRRENSLSSGNQAAFNHAIVRNAHAVEMHWRATDQLTAPRAEFLAGLLFGAARHFAEHDPDQFQTIADHIDGLAPGFVPREPAGLRHLARLVGFRRAERVAIRYRRIKRLTAPQQ